MNRATILREFGAIDAERKRRALARRGFVPCELHAKQVAFTQLPHLEAMFGGAAGGGKTEALLADALQYVDQPQFRALVLRRTYTDLSLPGSIMQRAIEWIGRERWNSQEKRFTFASGAIIQFGFCDSVGDLERYKSAQFHRIYIDEVTEWPEAWYSFLFSRIRRTKGDPIPLAMRTATNPDGIGADWVRRRFGIPEGEIVSGLIANDAEGRAFLPARAEDNPTLDLSSYEQSLSKLGPAKYQQLRWGRWIRDGQGLVYGAFDRAINCIPKLPDNARGVWNHILGIDFGIVDQNALAVLAWRANDPTVYVRQAYRLTAIPTEMAEEVKKLDAVYKFVRIVGDVGGMGKSFAEEMRQRHAIPVEAAEKQNKLGTISLLNGDMSLGRLKVIEGDCGDLIGEWLQLPWAAGYEGKKEAAGFVDHASHGVLYAWRACPAYAERVPDAGPALGSPEFFAAQEREMLDADLKRVEAEREERDVDWFQELGI